MNYCLHRSWFKEGIYYLNHHSNNKKVLSRIQQGSTIDHIDLSIADLVGTVLLYSYCDNTTYNRLSVRFKRYSPPCKKKKNDSGKYLDQNDGQSNLFANRMNWYSWFSDWLLSLWSTLKKIRVMIHIELNSTYFFPAERHFVTLKFFGLIFVWKYIAYNMRIPIMLPIVWDVSIEMFTSNRICNLQFTIV